MKPWWRLGAPLVVAVCIGALGAPGGREGFRLHGGFGDPVLSFDAAAQSVRAVGLERRLLAALAARMPAAPGVGSAFAVYLGDARVPMLGDYRVAAAALCFTPRLPLLPGRAYRAALDLRRLYALAGVRQRQPDGAVLRLSFALAALAAPAPPAARTQVTAVFPSGDVVPANLLRIYVHFSQPMARRGIARHVRLLDDGGAEVPRAFLEMPDGLWDPAGRRLTLFLHPGRIKRGVGLHEALGLPLQAGRRYRLVVAREAEDAAGMQLAEPFVKELRVAAPDRSAPDVHKWRLYAPPPGTRQALTVAADKSLDQPLFGRLLRLLDAAGRPVKGRASVESGETRWRFAPGEPWREGDYVLRVGGELEDLAGNRPTRLFDQPAAPGGRRREARDVEVRLRIGGPAAPAAAAPPAPDAAARGCDTLRRVFFGEGS